MQIWILIGSITWKEIKIFEYTSKYYKIGLFGYFIFVILYTASGKILSSGSGHRN